MSLCFVIQRLRYRLRNGIKMRVIDFKMEREGQVNIGDTVKVNEGILPSSYYYTVEPSVAMSGNFKFNQRLQAREGKVIDIVENARGFYIKVEFDED